MPRATVTSKGQITIPAEVRRALDLREGDQLDITMDARGAAQLRKLRPLTELCGLLGRPPRNADATTIQGPFRDLDV